MVIAILKEDIYPINKKVLNRPYAKQGDKVTIIKEHEGADGVFCTVEAADLNRFLVNKTKLIYES